MVFIDKQRDHLEVRMEGLEPAHLSALDPKSSVSTNFTTSAYYINTTVFYKLISIIGNSVEFPSVSTIPIAIGITTSAYLNPI